MTPPDRIIIQALKIFAQQEQRIIPDLKQWGRGPVTLRVKMRPDEYKTLDELATQYTNGNISKMVQIVLTVFFKHS